LPPAPRGIPQVEVTFDIDANGIVNVSAKDKATGKEQQIRIQASGGLSDEDIEGMINEAEQNAESDKERRDLVETKNQAEQVVHSTDRMLVDFGEKINEEEKAEIEKQSEELKMLLDGEDGVAIKAGMDALQQSSMKLGEAMYKAQQEAETEGSSEEGEATGQDDASSGPAGTEADVVDADFEEVDDVDDKKSTKK
jgi:molecular chaperone DnaK